MKVLLVGDEWVGGYMGVSKVDVSKEVEALKYHTGIMVSGAELIRIGADVVSFDTAEDYYFRRTDFVLRK
jgi:hypothetical protein